MNATLPSFAAEGLGCPLFRQRHHLKYAYVAGGMYKGVSSKEMVIRLGKAGFLGFLGTGGMILLGKHNRNSPLPFGPYLAAAGWIALLWGGDLNHLYLTTAGL